MNRLRFVDSTPSRPLEPGRPPADDNAGADSHADNDNDDNETDESILRRIR